MRYICSCLLLLSLVAVAQADVTILRAARVIVDAREAPLGPTTILVRDGRIVALSSGRSGNAPTDLKPNESVTEIDLGDRTVLPGLIDAHVHLASQYGVPWWQDAVRTAEYDVAVALHNAGITLRAGFTTVRDLGSEPRVM